MRPTRLADGSNGRAAVGSSGRCRACGARPARPPQPPPTTTKARAQRGAQCSGSERPGRSPAADSAVCRCRRPSRGAPSGSSALPRQDPGSDEGIRRQLVRRGTIDHAPPENVIRVPAPDAERVAGPIVAEGHQRRIQKPVSSCLHSPRDESVERPHHPPLTGFVEVAVAPFEDMPKPARQSQAYRRLGDGELILAATSHTTRLSEHR